MADNNTHKGVGVLVLSFLGALVVLIFGDFMVYDPDVSPENETALGFAEGSSGAELINVAPLLVLALGFYGAYREWE